MSRHCIISLLKEFRMVEAAWESSHRGPSTIATPTTGDTKDGMLRLRGNSHDSTGSVGASGDREIELSVTGPSLAEENCETTTPVAEVNRALDEEELTAVDVLNKRASEMRSTFSADIQIEMDRGGGSAALCVCARLVSVHVSLAMERAASAVADPHYRIHCVVTIFLWFISISLAILFNDLGVVLALTGAVAASCLGYILPALLYIKSYEAEFNMAKEVYNKKVVIIAHSSYLKYLLSSSFSCRSL